MATVTPIEELRRSPTAALFQGQDDIPVSIFVTEYRRGQGPDLHTHPYAEAFVVETGTALFTAGHEHIRVRGGNAVVVPPPTGHRVKSAGGDPLRVATGHPHTTAQ